ncbi:MAG TPA: glycolate oxidase subunit GlcF [Thermodesulfobacteriota bacterium]|nr:glycolate oxidase subunit GlcF [Thermodesulfobacteriota bacterium]
MSSFQAFDEIDRPRYDLIQDCVHCGFCLTACPTYLQTGNELDSPRGRIYLMKSAVEGKIPMAEGLVKHLDLCLGCLACETACPSGVRYGSLIESARSQIERRYERPVSERLFRSLLFSIFPYPKRLKLLLPFAFIYRASGLERLMNNLGVLPERLSHAQAILPDIKLSSTFSKLPNTIPAKGKRRFRVAMLAGCVQSVLFPRTNEATVRVLSENGCEVVIPEKQGCCGALSIHTGRLSEGRDLARANIDVFSGYNVDAIIVNSAGCGSSMKEYGEILREDQPYAEKATKLSEKTKDIMEFLADVGLQGHLKELKLRVTYQDACHIAHAQRIKAHPRKVIKQIPGIDFIELPESDLCCGSAGIYNLIQPKMSESLLDRKISNLKKTNVDYLVAGNPGCLLQIQMGIRRSGLKVKVAHPVELLDWAYSGGFVRRA